MLERLIAEAETAAQDQKIADERYVRKQRGLDEQVPGVWKRLRVALKSQCEKYPRHFGFEVRPDTEAVIRGTNRRVLEAQFLCESHLIAYRCGDVESHCTFGMDERNLAMICDAEGYPFPSVEYVAEKLLGLILKPV